MIDNAIKRLEYLCDVIPQLLATIDAQSFSLKSNPDKWSKKEIIGHLIDSATNNHQRFVRGQFEIDLQLFTTKTSGMNLVFIKKLADNKSLFFGQLITGN